MGDDDLGFDDDKIWFCPPLFMWGIDPYDNEKARMNESVRPAYFQRRHHGTLHTGNHQMGIRRKLRSIGLLVLCLGAYGYCDLLSGALARDDGRYAQSPLKGWFNSLKSKQGVPCCDTADGLRVEDVDWETIDGRYRVRIEGEWIDVPPEALIEQPNLAGPAIVWPVKSATGKTQIRCFIPGAGS